MNFKAGDVVAVDFSRVNGIKRRPAVILSSGTYHANRPDAIVGLLTSKKDSLRITDYILQDWQEANLKVSLLREQQFRLFFVQ